MPNESLRVPVFCPVCEGIMKGKSTTTYYNYNCCIDCYIYFIEGREEKWKSGWRPDSEQVKKKNEFMVNS